MTDTFSVLAQLPITTPGTVPTMQTLYTVPSATSTTISSVVVCNTNSSTVRFSMTVRSAAGLNTDQYFFYLLPIVGPNTYIATVGITLATGDIVKVQSDTASVALPVTVQLFGVQVT